MPGTAETAPLSSALEAAAPAAVESGNVESETAVVEAGSVAAEEIGFGYLAGWP